MRKAVIFFFMLSMLMIGSQSSYAGQEIILASTTSTENSGLFAYILPMFEQKTDIMVKVVARGTGAAIEMGKRGDADAVFVHAKEQELEAVKGGFFTDRHDAMYNDFVVIGPENDPSGVMGAKTAQDAFAHISEGSAPFLSRGDNSGTHTKEMSIWKKSGIDPKGRAWYLEAGQGMEKTQRIADEKRGYVLTDRGTWLATKKGLDMKLLFEGDPTLLNQYGVMAVNPQVHKHAKYKEAMEFINWIISAEGQQAIASFKDKFGNPMFVPNAD